MKKILLFAFLFMTLIELKAQSVDVTASSQTAELQQQALDSLSVRMKSAELVGLGEVSHGASEIFTVKAQLVKFLV